MDCYRKIFHYFFTIRTNCPRHNKYDLVSYKDTGKTWCYGCNWSGDIINYIQEKENCDFKEALQKACKIAGIEYKPENLTPEQLEKWKKEKQEKE